MNIREIIKKAREQAKTPDDMLLPERFEEYLDLLEMKQKARKEDRKEIDLRLNRTLSSLKEVAERVSLSYGMDPDKVVEFFSQSANLGPGIADPLSGVSTIEKEKPSGSSNFKLAKNNKKLRV